MGSNDMEQSCYEVDISKQGSGQFLSHPVIYGRRLYIHHWNNLYVYDISAL
ncbi:MAG: hypothetical protein ACYSUY_05115 [Planctomycetota bacterium]